MRHLKVFGLALAVTLSSGLLTVGTADAENTPEQQQFRANYTYKTNRKTREILDSAPNKARTTEENYIINRHWNQAYRALRIRELAQDDGDQATVNRTDGYLSRLDADYETQLRGAVARAPDRSNSPKLLWPVEGASLSLSRSSSICRFESDPNAVSYSCIVDQPSTGHRHNYFCSRNGDCYGDINDGRFVAGPARVFASKNIGDQYWTGTTVVNINIGGQELAAPRIESPAQGGVVKVDSVLPVRISGSGERFQCGIRQGYRSAFRETTSHTCDLHPGKDGLIAGPADVWAMAFQGGRWSNRVSIPITLTGGAAASGSTGGSGNFYVVSPRNGQTLTINRPFACRSDEFQGATGYKCTIRQGQHVTTNSAMGWAATTVMVNPTDFTAGPAEVTMQPILEGGRGGQESSHIRVNMVK